MKRKLLSIILCIYILTAIFPIAAFASDYDPNDPHHDLPEWEEYPEEGDPRQAQPVAEEIAFDGWSFDWKKFGHPNRNLIKAPETSPQLTSNNDNVANEDGEWIIGKKTDDYGTDDAFRFTFGDAIIDFFINEIVNEDGTPYKGKSTITEVLLKKDGDKWIIQFRGSSALENKTVRFSIMSRGSFSDTKSEILNTFFNYDEIIDNSSDFIQHRPFEEIIVTNNAENDDLVSGLTTATVAAVAANPIDDTDSILNLTIGDLGIATAVGVREGNNSTFSDLSATVGGSTSIRVMDGALVPQPIRDDQLTLAWATADGDAPAKLKIEGGNFVNVNTDGTISALTTGQAQAVAQGLSTARAYDSTGGQLGIDTNVLQNILGGMNNITQ